MTREWRWRVAVFAACLAAAVGLASTLRPYAVNLLFSDQWDFYRPFIEGGDLWTLFSWQHSPPRLGLGQLWLKLVLPLTGWDMRTEVYLDTGLYAVAALLALALMRRLRGRWLAIDLFLPLLFLQRSFYEVIVVTPNPAHGAWPAILLMTAAHLLVGPLDRKRLAGLAALSFLMAYTCFAIFGSLLLIGFIPMKLLWEKRTSRGTLLKAFAWAVAFALIFGSFFINYRFGEYASNCAAIKTPLLEYPGFVLNLLGKYFAFHGVSWGTRLLVVALLLGAGVLGWKTLRLQKHSQAIFPLLFLALFTLAFAASAAAGRVCLGQGAAKLSRYMPYVAPLGFALFFVVTESIAKMKSQTTRYLLWALVAFWSVWSSQTLSGSDNFSLDYYARKKTEWKICYLSTESIKTCDRETGFQIYPSAEGIHLAGKLQWLKERGLSLYKPQP